jgi:hypothetical protein
MVTQTTLNLTNDFKLFLAENIKKYCEINALRLGSLKFLIKKKTFVIKVDNRNEVNHAEYVWIKAVTEFFRSSDKLTIEEFVGINFLYF